MCSKWFLNISHLGLFFPFVPYAHLFTPHNPSPSSAASPRVASGTHFMSRGIGGSEGEDSKAEGVAKKILV